MKYSQSIQISRWQEISEKYNHYVSMVDKVKALHLPKEEFSFLESIVLDDLETQLNSKHRIQRAMLFFMYGNSNRGIHVDGDQLDRSKIPMWGLNIPILNCDNSEMKWYDGKYELEVISTPTGLDYLGLTWLDGPREIESIKIDKPTLIYANIPHTVVNYSDAPRVLLSLRFDPDLYIT
jgi:hypothetical protein